MISNFVMKSKGNLEIFSWIRDQITLIFNLRTHLIFNIYSLIDAYMSSAHNFLNFFFFEILKNICVWCILSGFKEQESKHEISNCKKKQKRKQLTDEFLFFIWLISKDIINLYFANFTLYLAKFTYVTWVT